MDNADFVSLPSGKIINLNLVAFIKVRGAYPAERSRGNKGEITVAFTGPASAGKEAQMAKLELHGADAEALLNELGQRRINPDFACKKYESLTDQD